MDTRTTGNNVTETGAVMLEHTQTPPLPNRERVAWIEYKLSDAIERFIDYRGKTPAKTTSGIPLVTAKIVKNGTIAPPNEFISEETYSKWMTRGFPLQDDVVLTTEAPLGEVALLKDAKAALAQRIILLRGKAGVCHNPFLKYYLQSSDGQARLQARASGSTVEGIKASVLREMEISLPPFPLQKAIAGILLSLDDKIDLLQRQNATLESLAETVFRQWFIEEAKPAWRTVKLTEILDVNPSRKLKKGETATYVDMGELSASAYRPQGWIERSFASGSKFINGDTLMARITPCLENGKTGFVDFLKEGQVAWGSTEFLVFHPKPPLPPFFAYLLSKNEDFRSYTIQNMTGSSGRQRVNPDCFTEYEFRLPSDQRIGEFTEFTASILPKMKHNSEEIQKLKSMRDSLLPKLMSGEVEVKEVMG